MRKPSLARLTDRQLLDRLATLLAANRVNDASVIELLAEVEARELHLAAGYSSMFSYAVEVLGLSEDAAYKRIRAARAARQFPALLGAVADGRLHLSAVNMIAPHLTDENASDLIAEASTRRTKAAIDRMLVERRPRPDVPPLVQAIPAPSLSIELAPGRVDPPTTKTTPLAPQRYALQVTIAGETQAKLERAQALLRHRVPSGDLAAVLDRALDVLLEDLEREKFAVTGKPRAAKAPSKTRRFSNDAQREIHARDGEQCAFVSDDGVRCGEKGFLEYDHVQPFALGGASTAMNGRLLCKAHNGYEARRRLGEAVIPRRDFDDDTYRAMRGTGVKPDDARAALAASAHVVAATLEERCRAAFVALNGVYARRCGEEGPRWLTAAGMALRAVDGAAVVDNRRWQ